MAFSEPRQRITVSEAALEHAAAAVRGRLLFLGLDPNSKATADLVETVLAVGGAHLDPVYTDIEYAVGSGTDRTTSVGGRPITPANAQRNGKLIYMRPDFSVYTRKVAATPWEPVDAVQESPPLPA